MQPSTEQRQASFVSAWITCGYWWQDSWWVQPDTRQRQASSVSSVVLGCGCYGVAEWQGYEAAGAPRPQVGTQEVGTQGVSLPS